MLSFKHPSILVVGDLMIDHYIWGDCNRISPEAPVQVVEVKNESNRLGGACNVINNLISLNAKVAVCGVIGQDEGGIWLQNKLDSMKVDSSNLYIQSNRPTTKKTRILISNHQVLRVDREDKSPIDEKLLMDIKNNIESAIAKSDCVIISDYNKGLLSFELTQHIITCAKKLNKFVLCDPKGKDYSKYKGSTLLTPNKKEAQEASNIQITDKQSLIQAGMYLKNKCDLTHSIITLSEDGIGIFESNDMIQIPTKAREVFDVTGAGDTVIATLGFALSSGCDIKNACEFANIAAAVVVGKVGSASATHSEIMQYMHTNFNHIESKIVSLENVCEAIKKLKAKQANAKIIFTNGCFDILHSGHITYLNKARALGDILIVGLNSDSSISRIKGANRPINDLNERSMMLSALECVDYVVAFEEDTPLRLIEAIKPDVLVKGGDYKGKEVVGAESSGEVVLIDFVANKSTTNLINKIISQHK